MFSFEIKMKNGENQLIFGINFSNALKRSGIPLNAVDYLVTSDYEGDSLYGD